MRRIENPGNGPPSSAVEAHKGDDVTSAKLCKAFNKTVRPGHPIRVDIPQIYDTELLKPAEIIDGEAMVRVKGINRPIPLRFVRPLGRQEGLL